MLDISLSRRNVKEALHPKGANMHNQKITTHHMVELLAAQVLFFLTEELSGHMAVGVPPGMGRTLVLFSPVLPVLLMVLVIVRYFCRIDEYLRLKLLENLAITAAIIFVGAFIYGSLEIVGFRQLSMFIICPAMGTIFALVSLIRGTAAR
jgi:hypothetical protein